MTGKSEKSLEAIHVAQSKVTDTAPPDFWDNFEIGRIPTAPGCYIMMDAKGKPIYVGKAKNLRARVRSYLNETDSRYSVKFLMQRVAKIEFLLTENEKEALLLENSLIKQHKPRYNVQLRDDKTFLSIRFDPREKFPRLGTVRRYNRDGAKYFGPFHSAAAVHQTLRQIHRLFPLRTCTDHVMNNRTRPCLYYQMKQCLAPCVGFCSKEEYAELSQQVVKILEGKSAELENDLLEAIKKNADNLEFEQAAVLRDRLYAVKGMFEKQRAVSVKGVEERDVFGLHQEGRFVVVQVIFYRGGKMLGNREFSFERTEMPAQELLSSLLLQFYTSGNAIPSEILLPLPLEDTETLAEIFSDERGTKVLVVHPQRGEKLALVGLANKNAQSSFSEKKLKEKSLDDTIIESQKALGLSRPPNRIECFDISTVQGAYTVASMVCFVGAQPDKSRYRKYSIKTVDGQDDFASMREALLRRFTRAIEEDDLPDLVLIDGGKGQLGVCHAVFKDLGIEDLPHISIAKSRNEEQGRSPERFFVPRRANPIILPQSGGVVRLMAQIRDEAHRFAITYHRKKRAKAGLRSILLSIPGVGEARTRALLKAFGSIARIRSAALEEIVELPGFNRELAERIKVSLSLDTKSPL